MNVENSSDILNLLSLPSEIIEKVLGYFSYEEIAHLRRVCKTFDTICQGLLNKGFHKVDLYHGYCLRLVKSQLPRRESERRNHPLARHCDILNAVETRLSLLSMTFLKYVDLHLCCFIPGKVIDEIYKVLTLVQNTKCPSRPHEILQELRDISSMAMEHFDEKIAPVLKQNMLSSGGHINTSPTSSLNLQSLVGNSCSVSNETPKSLRSEIVKLQLQCKQNKSSVALLCKDATNSKVKLLQQEKKAQEHEKSLLELNTIIGDQNAKVMEQEGRLNEVNQKLIEYENQITALIAMMANRKPWTCEEKESGISGSRCLASTSCKSDNSKMKSKRSSTKRKCSESSQAKNAKLLCVRVNPPRRVKMPRNYCM